MPRSLRATLRGVWWTQFFARIRHCYVCGKRLEKRYVPAEKKRRLVCVKCGEITYSNPKIVAGMIPVLPDGRIALARREIEPARGKWTYPAGFQEMGETVEEAAIRETWEEIRARVTSDRLLGVYSYADAGVVTIVYVGKLAASEKPRPGDESQEVKVFAPKDIPWKDLAFRSTTQALQEWLTGKKVKAPPQLPALFRRRQLGK